MGEIGGGKEGGDSTTNTYQQNHYDPETQKVLRENMVANQEMAEEAWGMWKESAAPYEKDMYAANRELLPLQQQSAEAALRESIYDTEQGREVKDALRQQQLDELSQSAPVSAKFYEESMEGLDPETEANKAMVDVQSAAAREKEAMESDLSSYGIDPSSGKYANLDLQRRMDTSRNVVGARTDARTRARNENYGRLSTAMGVRGRATGLPGTTATTGSTDSFGNYNLQNLANQAGSFYGGSTQAAQAGMVKLGSQGRQTDKYTKWNAGAEIDSEKAMALAAMVMA